jgi:hypothetical protein
MLLENDCSLRLMLLIATRNSIYHPQKTTPHHALTTNAHPIYANPSTRALRLIINLSSLALHRP